MDRANPATAYPPESRSSGLPPVSKGILTTQKKDELRIAGPVSSRAVRCASNCLLTRRYFETTRKKLTTTVVGLSSSRVLQHRGHTLAAKKTRARGANKSEAIREVLKQNPKANVKEVQQVLKERGVKASDALVNKVKYGRNGAVGKPGRRSKNGAKVNKAEAIRVAWSELGTDARPRDVIAHLATRRIRVSSAQVSTLRKSAPRGKSAVASSVVPFEHLIAAKVLASRLGGIEPARQALNNLARLWDA